MAATAVQNTLYIKRVTFCVSPSGWLRKPSHPSALKRWPRSSLQVELLQLGPIPLPADWTLRYTAGSEPITYVGLEALHHFCSMGQNSSGTTGCFFGLDPLVSMTRTRALWVFFFLSFLVYSSAPACLCLLYMYISFFGFNAYLLVLSYSNWNTYSTKNKWKYKRWWRWVMSQWFVLHSPTCVVPPGQLFSFLFLFFSLTPKCEQRLNMLFISQDSQFDMYNTISEHDTWLCRAGLDHTLQFAKTKHVPMSRQWQGKWCFTRLKRAKVDETCCCFYKFKCSRFPF